MDVLVASIFFHPCFELLVIQYFPTVFQDKGVSEIEINIEQNNKNEVGSAAIFVIIVTLHARKMSRLLTEPSLGLLVDPSPCLLSG